MAPARLTTSPTSGTARRSENSSVTASQPGEITNVLALCALHHTLFDLGILGITVNASSGGCSATTRLAIAELVQALARDVELLVGEEAREL
jgi:hypothetical protein